MLAVKKCKTVSHVKIPHYIFFHHGFAFAIVHEVNHNRNMRKSNIIVAKSQGNDIAVDLLKP